MKKIIWLLVIMGLGVGLMFQLVKMKASRDLDSRAKQKEVPMVVVGTTEATNSEGNLKLVGVSRKTTGAQTTYEFKIVDSQKNTEVPIYKTVADPGSEIEIPRNSWSPDYKQVFIKMNSPEGENYFVFRANGENYIDGGKYLAVGDYWREAKMKSKIRAITGWAGNDLLMVYTLNEDGLEGPAYWFVTSTRKFMQVREF